MLRRAWYVGSEFGPGVAVSPERVAPVIRRAIVIEKRFVFGNLKVCFRDTTAIRRPRTKNSMEPPGGKEW